MERYPYWNSCWRTAACGKYPHWKSSWGSASHGSDPTLEQGKSVESSAEEKGVAETTVMKWPQLPFPVLLHPWVRGGRKFESDIEPEEGKSGWEKGVFKIGGLFLLSYSDLISDKLNQFSQAASVLPVVVSGAWSLLIHEPFVIFSLPCPAEEKSDRAAFGE